MSIIKALNKIQNEHLTSFHVPGHKNGRLLNHLNFGPNIQSYDTTEIPGTDNLHDSEDVLKQAQKSVADFYKVKESFFLVNGTTSGIISMMYAAFQPGDKVIVSRDAHKSVFTGLILAQLEPVYLSPIVDQHLGLSIGITSEMVQKAYEGDKGIKGVVLTYPSYHGICTDIQKIVKIVHGQNGLVLVDGAHGAHLNLNNELPLSAIESGADIVVHSTHKSLPALTQSSLLHYCTDNVSLERLKLALAMFQSSSPSYLLMASLENAVMYAKEEGAQKMTNLLRMIDSFRTSVEAQTPFKILKVSNLPTHCNFDPTKITLLTGHIKIRGGLIAEVLRQTYGVQCEYATDSVVLFITSIATIEKDLNTLHIALNEISQEKQLNIQEEKWLGSYDFQSFSISKVMKPYEAVHAKKEACSLQDAVNRIVADFIVPYPPGVPILVPGEVISEQVVNYIEEGYRKGYNINGVFFDKTLKVNIIRR